ncbi:MAG: LysE family translocator [Pseudomonadota bacterium]|nr:LysE family translocator [Pseudomonadota bacterium]
MFGTRSLALFALTALVLNLTPGVDMMFTLTRTLQQGVRGGVAAAAGICAGCVVHSLAAAFGLAALLAASAAAFILLKWLGAAYLAWLAIAMLRDASRPGEPALSASAMPLAAASLGVTFRQAIVTNVLNPKVAIFFLALLPQFIDADAPNKTLAFLFLGACFVAQGFLFLILFSLLVAPLRRWRPSPAWRRSLQASGGLLFAGLAARLALTERP